MEKSGVVGWRALMGWQRVAGVAVALAALVADGAAPPASAAPTPASAAPTATGGGPTATGGGPTAQGSVPSPAGSSCLKAAGPFSVHGTQVLGKRGQPFVSYGLTVPGLQVLDWRNFTVLDQLKIEAAAVDWCANTVRLQLSQDNLFGPNGTGFDQSYLDAIQSEVALAESYDLVVVINDQTEFGGPIARSTQRGPTAATEAFWKDMTSLYGNDPQVIFDLFNEPRMYSAGMSQAQKWQLWLNGGSFGGTFYPFGMAGLAAYVRDTLGARNLFWIEGPDNSDSFAGMVSSGALLKVSGVVYALHHPAGPAGPGLLGRRLRLPGRDRRRARGGRRVDELRAGPDRGLPGAAQFVLADRAHGCPAVPGVPVLARHRPERLPAPAGLPDQVLPQPGRSHHDHRAHLELPVEPGTAARPGHRVAAHDLVRAAERLGPQVP